MIAIVHSRRISKPYLLAACTCAMLVTASAAFADKAEQLLGVHDLDPMVREVIDEAYADGEAAIALLLKQVGDGEMHPGDAAEQMVTAAQGGVMETLSHLGLKVEALRLQSAWAAFAKAQFEAKTSQNIKLPKVAAAASADADLPEGSDHADDTSGPDIDKTLKKLDRQLAHSVESHVKTPSVSENPDRHDHVQKVRASVDTGDVQARADTKRPDIDSVRERINTDAGDISANAGASVPGDLHPGAKANAPSIADISTASASAGNLPELSKSSLSVTDPSADAPSLSDISGDVSGATAGIDNVGQNVSADVGDISENPAISGISEKVDGVTANTGLDNLQQTVQEKISTPDITQKVSEAVDAKALREKVMSSVGVDAIKSKSSAVLDVKLDAARDRIKAAMGTAFGTVNSFMQKQVDTKQADFNQKQAAYNAISVPPIRNDRICAKHIIGICVKHAEVPNADSVREHNEAQSKKDTAKGLMDGASKELQKYQQGQQTLLNTETDTYSNLDSAFTGANTSATVTTSIDSTASDDTPEDPKSDKRKVPGEGKDTHVVELDNGVIDNIEVAGSITAALGDEATATTFVGDIGDTADTRVGGQVDELIIAPGIISASLGYNTASDVRIADIDGTVGGKLNRQVNTVGVLSAAIGGDSYSTVSIANIDGHVTNSARQDATVVGALAAAVGGNTSATVRMANLGEGVTVGSLDQRIIQATPAIAAAIGYDSDALISVGQIDADVTGDLKQHITLGSVIAAAVGADTQTNIRIGDVTHKVTGDLTQTITIGDVTNIAIGANTQANTDVGVIAAPVTGDVNMNINTGVITTATVGVGTRAQSIIGSVYAPVNGDLDVDIGVGDTTTFSIGIGTGSKHITANTFIGSVFTPVNGSRRISVHTGAVTALGFGLDIDLGPLGELDISISGCDSGSLVNIGNIGSPPC